MTNFTDLGDELWAGPFAANGAGTIAASAEANYGGANLTATVTNDSTKVVRLMGGGITIGGDQRLECVVYNKYTGAVPAGMIIGFYQRVDAFDNRSLNLPPVILRPGERLAIRIFNRAPAAVANATITVIYYQIEQRVYDQYITQKRQRLEAYGGV